MPGHVQSNPMSVTPESRRTSSLPDPILRLRAAIGLNLQCRNLLWTRDDNYVLFSSDAIVVQMHIDSQQQWFFTGHTDKVSGMALASTMNVLATIQTGQHGKLDQSEKQCRHQDFLSPSIAALLRLWNVDTRRCLCTATVPNAYDLHAVDLIDGQSSNGTVVAVGRSDTSMSVICLYNASNGSLELLCRATAQVSITHVRLVPTDARTFVSIGLDNIHLWSLTDRHALKSTSISTTKIDRPQYTDLQLIPSSKTTRNGSLVYVATKTGHILSVCCHERRVIRIHDPSNRPASMHISAFACTEDFFITGSNDGYVRLWSADLSQVYIEANYEHEICALVYSHDQTRVLISTRSGSLAVLNLVSKVHANVMRAHTGYLTDMDYDSERQQLLTVGQDRTIRVWCLQTVKQLAEFTSERETPLVVSFAPHRHEFACGFNNGTIKVFDLTKSILSIEIE